jgi:hypothetical protein
MPGLSNRARIREGQGTLTCARGLASREAGAIAIVSFPKPKGGSSFHSLRHSALTMLKASGVSDFIAPKSWGMGTATRWKVGEVRLRFTVKRRVYARARYIS